MAEREALRAVIVDDEQLAGEYLADLCETVRGVEVLRVFNNSPEALAFLQQNHVDLLFVDIEMPGMTGLELVRRVRGLRHGIGVVFVTGYDQYALDAFRLDAVAYLLKPCTAEEVAHAVEKARRLAPPQKRVELRTFGAFAVLIDGEPYRFENKKAKELLALLADRRGAAVGMEEAVSLLWEGRPYDETVKQLYRKAVIRLNQMDRDMGLGLFVSNRGSCNIRPEQVFCDYYRLLDGEETARPLYGGEYLREYSWAEETVARLNRLADGG